MTARVETAARVCESCGDEFERRTFSSGRLEDATAFAKRRFCSRTCYRDAADGPGKPVPSVWIHGPHEPTAHEGAANEGSTRQASGRGYPWDRKPAPGPAAIPGHFSAGRQRQVPDPRREA